VPQECAQGFEAGPTDGFRDENVAMDPDENLPWPDSGSIQTMWEQNKSNNKNDARNKI
jgi:hypothetical protein